MTPAEATRRPRKIHVRWPSPTAVITIDLVTKPEKNGRPAIEAAAMMQHTVVTGIDL